MGSVPLQEPLDAESVRPCSARPLIVGSAVFDGGAVGAASPSPAGNTSAHTARSVRSATATIAQRSERVVRDIIPPLVVTGYDGSEGCALRTLADLLHGLTSRLRCRLPSRAAPSRLLMTD